MGFVCEWWRGCVCEDGLLGLSVFLLLRCFKDINFVDWLFWDLRFNNLIWLEIKISE